MADEPGDGSTAVDAAPAPALRAPPIAAPEPATPRGGRWLHFALFALTFISATWAYLVPRGGDSYLEALWASARDPRQMSGALLFASTLMAILLAHEMGHWVTARRSGVDQSLPYFIPAPTFVGTLGAIIVMRSQPPNRSVLLRVAVMGPYAGLLLALPAAAWGLAHSELAGAGSLDPARPFLFGSSILFDWLRQTFGPEGGAVDMHPVAFAGWVGLFVTSLNLIPASQLDGGHVAYALFGARQVRLSLAIVAGLFVMGLFTALPAGGEPNLGGAVWIFWALVLFVVGVKHPPVRDESRVLSRAERAGGWLALALFIVTFTPVPVTVLSPRRAWQPPTFELPFGHDEEEVPTEGESRPAEEFRL